MKLDGQAKAGRRHCSASLFVDGVDGALVLTF